MKPLGFLLFLIIFFSCKSDPNTSVKTQKINSEDTAWPKTQESIEDIEKHYDQTFYLNTSILGASLAAKKDGSWSVLDLDNRLYFPFSYDTLVSNRSSVALKRNGTYEIYDTSRILVAEIRSDDLLPIFNHFYLSRKKDKLALVNPNGMMVSEHDFDQITGPKDGSYFLGRKGDQWSAYDMAGQEADSTSKAIEALKWIKEYRVGLKSYGPISLGMTKNQIEEALGWELNDLYGDEFCFLYDLGSDFLDIQLMINTSIGESLTLERIYIYASEVITKSGIGLGSTKKELLDAYGSKIKAQENTYDDDAEDLFYVPSDRRDKLYRLNFLSRRGQIESYSVGRLPSINFVEGCL